MKSIYNLYFIVVSLCIDKVLPKHLREDDVVGVSQKKLTDKVTQALLGYRNVLRNGDDELGHIIVDPAELSSRLWHVDNWPKVSFVSMSKQGSVLTGLSNYQTEDVNADARGLWTRASLTFEKLEAKIPYEIYGSFVRNVLPIYGLGVANMTAQNVSLQFILKFLLDQDYLIVDDVHVHTEMDDLQIHVTGLMDLDDDFVNFVIEDKLKDDKNKLIDSFVRSILLEVAENAFGGMTMDELIEFVDYLAKKPK